MHIKYWWPYKIRPWLYRASLWPKNALRNWKHKRNPDLHEWKVAQVQDCGCCGFEGIWCLGCDAYIILGHTGSHPDHPVESGDFAEYGY